MKKADNTTYDVSFHYSRQSRESMNDKIIRLIENDMQSVKKNWKGQKTRHPHSQSPN